MVKVGGLSAWITIGANKDVAEEFDITTVTSPDAKERQAQVTTCYIASRIKEKFSVNFRHTTNGAPRRSDMAFKVRVDGISCRSLNHPRSSPGDMLFEVSYAKISAASAKELMFSQIELTDDDAALGSATTQHIGDIVVEIWDAIVILEPTANPTRYKMIPDSATEKVHEKLKKGSAHRVKFGETIPVRPCESRKTKWVTLKHRFIFKYRPIDMLRAQGIAPAAVKASPRLKPWSANANIAGSSTLVKAEHDVAEQKPDISLGVIDLTEDDFEPTNSMKRKREESGTVKREKKPRLDVLSLGTIDLT